MSVKGLSVVRGVKVLVVQIDDHFFPMWNDIINAHVKLIGDWSKLQLNMLIKR